MLPGESTVWTSFLFFFFFFEGISSVLVSNGSLVCFFGMASLAALQAVDVSPEHSSSNPLEFKVSVVAENKRIPNLLSLFRHVRPTNAILCKLSK